jgi:diaminopimelate decarboxylase
MEVNKLGHLTIGGCDTTELVKEFGTPLYVLDEEGIRTNCRRYNYAFKHQLVRSEVIYAGKAFLTLAMCKIIQEEGLGLDVVSGGELFTALYAGFPPERIYFHGNNKTYEELNLALEYDVGRIIVDNFFELEMLSSIAEQKRKKVNVLLRITPGIEAHTHEYIQTGQMDSKFGFDLSSGHALRAVEKVLHSNGLRLQGFHAHIGSQIFIEESYELLIETMFNFINDVRKAYSYKTKELNLGGGIGIRYTKEDNPATIEDFAKTICTTAFNKAKEFGIECPKIIVEPGRSIVGEMGTTLYTIGAMKEIPGIRKYVAVDGGMGDNPRPALYRAKYEGIIANKAKQAAVEVVSIAGKCCESGDMLIWNIPLPKVESGDILAVFCTGAYNYSMSSNYNRIPRPAVVLVNDGRAELIVKREDYKDILRNDILPKRLGSTFLRFA